MFMWPKNLQQAEVARYVVESASRCIVQLAKAMGRQTAGKRCQDLEGYVNWGIAKEECIESNFLNKKVCPCVRCEKERLL